MSEDRGVYLNPEFNKAPRELILARIENLQRTLENLKSIASKKIIEDPNQTELFEVRIANIEKKIADLAMELLSLK
jgi:hypothetical protein